jgi:glutathione synthase/RimK-type ligase-like ATP-grasp enzyme
MSFCREYEDLTNGQLMLQELVERHGIPVFNDIQTALKCTAKVSKPTLS